MAGSFLAAAVLAALSVPGSAFWMKTEIYADKECTESIETAYSSSSAMTSGCGKVTDTSYYMQECSSGKIVSKMFSDSDCTTETASTTNDGTCKPLFVDGKHRKRTCADGLPGKWVAMHFTMFADANCTGKKTTFKHAVSTACVAVAPPDHSGIENVGGSMYMQRASSASIVVNTYTTSDCSGDAASTTSDGTCGKCQEKDNMIVACPEASAASVSASVSKAAAFALVGMVTLLSA